MDKGLIFFGVLIISIGIGLTAQAFKTEYKDKLLLVGLNFTCIVFGAIVLVRGFVG